MICAFGLNSVVVVVVVFLYFCFLSLCKIDKQTEMNKTYRFCMFTPCYCLNPSPKKLKQKQHTLAPPPPSCPPPPPSPPKLKNTFLSD